MVVAVEAPECLLCRPSDGMARRPIDPSRPVVRPDCSPKLLMQVARAPGYYAIGDYAWSVSDCTLCSAPPATQASMGDCGPWGGAGEELLGATPSGAAGRRPNRGCGPRAAAEASTADLPGRGP